MENYRTVTKQIKSLNVFADASAVALAITEKAPDLNHLSEEHINTLMWLNTVLLSDNSDTLWPQLIAEATLAGLTSIRDTLSEIAAILVNAGFVLTEGGADVFLDYAISPRLRLYSIGLIAPRESFILVVEYHLI